MVEVDRIDARVDKTLSICSLELAEKCVGERLGAAGRQFRLQVHGTLELNVSGRSLAEHEVLGDDRVCFGSAVGLNDVAARVLGTWLWLFVRCPGVDVETETADLTATFLA